MKKKITLLFLIIFAEANIYSQNYNISFAATGASSTVSSVKVENLMQNTSVTLNAGDILHLGSTIGVNEIGTDNENLQIYPNPMQDNAELSFYADKDGDAKISIVDITGKEVMRTDNKFTRGIQKFRITGLKQGMYFINIKGDSYSYSSKLISQNTNQNEKAAIEYLGFENANKNILKNTNTTVNMAYTTGNRLLFKGTSGNYSNIIIDIPTTSKTLTFNFTACSDFDNNNYATVKIGTQTWMAENLKTTHYNIGTAIPNVTDSAAWVALTTGAYCDLNNSPTNSTTYGRLYNWYTVNTGNLCPTGWHVPTDAEWTTLTTYLGGESIAGGQLKEAGFAHWNSPNTSATNETGFSALPSGGRGSDGIFYAVGNYGYWWSSSDNGTPFAYYRYMGYCISSVIKSSDTKQTGFSVYCIHN